MTTEQTIPMRDGSRPRGFGSRLAALVLVIVVLTGVVASLAYAKTRPAPVGTGVVVVETSLTGGQGAGTGIVLTSSGEVLTNNHVIRGATRIRIVLPGTGRSYSAKVLGYSVSKDVAVIKANRAANLKTVPLGNSSTVRIGQPVIATGNGGGTGSLTSSTGRITALRRTITVNDESGGGRRLTGLIETNSELEPGDSGGPLFNAARKVVGMNTAASVGYRFRGSRDAEGYAIPINTAIAVAKQIEAGKSSATVHVGATAFLGVSVASSPTGEGGVVLAGVVPGEAAAAAGLTAGDVLTSLDGRAITSPDTLRSAILRQKPGASVPVTYVDATGASGTVMVTLGSGPPH